LILIWTALWCSFYLESIISPLRSCRHLVIRLTISSLDCASSLCLLPSHHRVRLFFASHSQTHLDCISPSSFRANSATGAIRNRPKCSRHGHVAAWRAELVTRGAISASRARAVHGPRVQAAYDDYAVPPAYPPSADVVRIELILTPSDRLILIAAPPALIPPSLALSCRLLLHPALWLIRLILIPPLFSPSCLLPPFGSSCLHARQSDAGSLPLLAWQYSQRV